MALIAGEAASASAAKATYAGGALSAIGGIALSNETIALLGLLLAMLGWATQVYFGWRRDHREADTHRRDAARQEEKDRRDAEEHELRMAEIRKRMQERDAA